MNYAYLSHVKLKQEADHPVYLQLRDAFKELISTGILVGEIINFHRPAC